jgi:hypothetical protein
MFEYIQSLLGSNDICVQVGLLSVIVIIILLFLKYIISTFFVESFTDTDGYEKVAFLVRENARSSTNDGKVNLQLAFPVEVKEEEVKQ